MYFVLTREEEDFKESFGGAWGYYWDLKSAIDAAHRNVTDMHETIYPYAIKAVKGNWGDIHNDKYDVVYIECIAPYVIAWALELRAVFT